MRDARRIARNSSVLGLFAAALSLPAGLLGAGCSKGATSCTPMMMPGPLFTEARRIRVEVYGEEAACEGPRLAPGAGAPLFLRAFGPGVPLRADVTPGRRTVVIVAFSDDEGRTVIGTACAT